MPRAPTPRKNQRAAVGTTEDAPVRKVVSFDKETWQAVDLYTRDSFRSFQELMDEAVRDLLRKHNRPVDLKEALRRSARPAEDRSPRSLTRKARRGRSDEEAA